MNVGSTGIYHNHLLCRPVSTWMLAGAEKDCKSEGVRPKSGQSLAFAGRQLVRSFFWLRVVVFHPFFRKEWGTGGPCESRCSTPIHKNHVMGTLCVTDLDALADLAFFA
jgi:hypothetical protein